jgi:hypothetical protein
MTRNNLISGILIFIIILIIIQIIVKTFTLKIEYFVEVNPTDYPGFEYAKPADLFFLNPPAQADPRSGIITGATQVKYDCDPETKTLCKFDYVY